MNKLILSAAIFTSALVLSSSPVFAGSGTYGTTTTVCQPTYGGNTCENTSLLIDKKVADPTTMTKGGVMVYKDNLGVNDAKYGAGQTVNFQIVVTNTSDSSVSNIIVKDILPEYLTITKGMDNDWKYDTSSRTLSTTISSLNPNESKTFTLSAVVVSLTQLPTGQDVTCVTNQSFATLNDVTVQDNAQLCIQKTMPVFPAPKAESTPKTGPEALMLFGLIPTGLGGLLLRKRTNQS